MPPLTLLCVQLALITTPCLLLGCAVAPPAFGQQPEPSGAIGRAAIRNRFETAIDAAAKRWRVAIVAESSPITEAIGADTSPAVPNDNADTALRRIATAFDYTFQRIGGVVVLRKRYLNPEDLPDITLGEACDALRSIAAVIGPFDAKFEYAPRPAEASAYAISRALTQVQLKALGTGGVPVSTLDQNQRAVIQKFAYQFYVSELAADVRNALDLLEPVYKTGTDFRHGIVGGSVETGFDVVLVLSRKRLFKPISHPNSTVVLNNGSTIHYSAAKVQGTPKQLTDPTEPDFIAHDYTSAPRQHTVADAVASLDPAPSGVRCFAAREIADKLLSFAGLQAGTTDGIARAIASIYGLEVRHRRDGTVMIMRPVPRDVADIMEVKRALLPLVPPSVAPCIEARRAGLRTFPIGFRATPHVSRSDYLAAAGREGVTALRELRAAVEPKLVRSPDSKVKLKDLDQFSSNSFVVSQCIGALADALWTAERNVPPYIADFDHVILTGGVSRDERGEQRLALFLSYADLATGKLMMGVGVSNAVIPP